MAEVKNFRIESDLLGELKVPADALYGVQTQRGINNYHISRKTMRAYPDFIIAIAYVKLAAIETNHTLGVINDEISGQSLRLAARSSTANGMRTSLSTWYRAVQVLLLI